MFSCALPEIGKLLFTLMHGPNIDAQKGKQQRLAAQNRARTSSGECQQLLAKAIEGDREREVRTLALLHGLTLLHGQILGFTGKQGKRQGQRQGCEAPDLTLCPVIEDKIDATFENMNLGRVASVDV